MAATPIEARYNSGQTLTLNLFPYGSDVAAATGLVLTEETNRKGIYTAIASDNLVGWYTAHVLLGGGVVAVFDLYMIDDVNVKRSHDAPVQLHQETPNNAVTEVNLDGAAGAKIVDGGFGYTAAGTLSYLIWIEVGGVRVPNFDSDPIDTVTIELQGRTAQIPFPTTPVVDSARGVIQGIGTVGLPDNEPVMADVTIVTDGAILFRGGIPVVSLTE
jgi:hypothetical protein